jgi:DNA-binding response OmpR family regulator
VMRFEVKDDGPGLTEAQRGRLFRPFEQLDSSTSKRQGGTGLGLALVKRMVEAQGGTVGVESAPGKGSTFFVELPEHMVEIERTGPATGPRILVVEDEPGDRKHLETILARSGYNVDSVTNRADASARLKAAHYDAVILDLILPDGHGMTLVSEMRSQERTMLTPVIVVTVVPEEQLAWAFPIQGYISKPVRSEQLHAILRAQGIVPDNRTPALIVDANDYTAHIVAQALRKLGCASHVAGTDSAAQELMRRHTPSLVVVAIAAAPADVLRFLEWLRQEPAYAMIPVIAWAPGKIPPSERARLRLAAKHVLEENSGDLVRTLESVLTVPVAHG